MDVKDLNTDGDPVLAKLLKVYSEADAVSIENAAIYKKIIAALSAAATLVTLAFLLYDEASQYWMIALCGILLLALFFINRLAVRLQCHKKYLEYRLYAESLRVQIFLHAAGIGKSVTELLPWAWKMNVPWIEENLKKLWTPHQMGKRTAIIDIWIRGQKEYHERAEKKTRIKAKRNDRIVGTALVTAVGFYLAGLLFEIICGGLFTGKPLLDPDTVERGRTILKILLGTISAATLFAGDYYGKLSLDETIDDHRRMAALYDYAEKRIEKDGETEEILIDLAREELSENSSWYAYQMKNKPDIGL